MITTDSPRTGHPETASQGQSPRRSSQRLAAGLLALILIALPVSAQTVVIESTVPAEDAENVPLETVVTFNLNEPTPAFGSQFVSKFRWGPVSEMRLTTFGHDFDNQGELTIIFFTMDHEPDRDFAFWAFGVESESGSRMAAPFALNYTTATTSGNRDVTGSVQFGERTLGGPSKGNEAPAGTAAWSRRADHVGFFRRSIAASGVPAGAATPGKRTDRTDAEYLDEAARNPSAFVDASRAARTSAASSQNLGYSVALLLDSYSLNDNVWRVRKAAVADGSGSFAFDHVRDGTYYPVTFNYTDITGSTVGSYGFHDADGDLEPDPIVVSGGTVSGIDMTLFEAGPFAAGANLNLAYDLALREADDAELVRIRSFDGPVFQSVYTDGTADLWGYVFHSASQESLIYIALDAINVYIDVEEDFGFNRGAIGDLTVSSDEALSIANANGGNAFRARYPDLLVPVYMDVGDLDLQVRPEAGEVFWFVRYSSPAGSQDDDELTIFVDAQTGDILPAMDIANEHDRIVPALVRLLPSYPNPFGAETTFSFELDRPSDVHLRVFDVLGREVETLIDAPLVSGIHRETWRANGLPNGMYIVRLEAGGSVLTRSVHLAR